jgi:Zn-dependent protease with chaperone function
MRDRALCGLVVAAVAAYPAALGLGRCVAALLSTPPAARQLGLTTHPAALAAVVLVGISVVAVGSAVWTVASSLRHTRTFHGWVADHRVPLAGSLAAAAAEVSLCGRVRLVATGEKVAVTTGLARPYVVVSTGLIEALDNVELLAVLAHEQAHLRRRDPLRVLLARTLVAHLWFLPVARDLHHRARFGYELAADRDAVGRFGRRALAGALLGMVSSVAGRRTGAEFGGSPKVIVTRFATDPEMLETRVSQLESGRPARPTPIAPTRAALTLVGAVAFIAAVAGAWALMLTCPCAML